MDFSHCKLNSSGYIKIHSLCRKSYISRAILFCKKLSVCTLHNLKFQCFLRVTLTWWTKGKTVTLEEEKKLRAFLGDLSQFQICSLSLFNTMLMKSRLRNAFSLWQISSLCCAVFPLLYHQEG